MHPVIDFASGEVLNFGLKVRTFPRPTLRMGVYWIQRLPECLNESWNWYSIHLFVIEGVEKGDGKYVIYTKQSCHLPILVGQRDLTVISYIAGEGATVPRKSLIQML